MQIKKITLLHNEIISNQIEAMFQTFIKQTTKRSFSTWMVWPLTNIRPEQSFVAQLHVWWLWPSNACNQSVNRVKLLTSSFLMIDKRDRHAHIHVKTSHVKSFYSVIAIVLFEGGGRLSRRVFVHGWLDLWRIFVRKEGKKQSSVADLCVLVVIECACMQSNQLYQVTNELILDDQ